MITLDQWRRLDDDGRLRYAEALAAAIGADRFELTWPATASRVIRLARFTVRGREFVLVPGGTARLGFDAGRFEPTHAEMGSFLGDDVELWRREDDDEPEAEPEPEPDPWLQPVPVIPGQEALFPWEPSDLPSAPAPPPVVAEPDEPWRAADEDLARLREFMAARLTAPRTVTMPTLLVGVEFVQAGRAEVPVDHPAVVAKFEAHEWQPGTLGWDTGWIGEDNRGMYTAARFEGGRLARAWTDSYVTFDEVVAELAADGWRLPSPDEYEYMTGLGSGHLFAWGDRMAEPPELDLVTGLRRPTGYFPELTGVRAEVRGSDWGEAACGGYGDFHNTIMWVPAYRNAEVVAGEAGLDGVRARVYRPVFEAPQVNILTFEG